MPLGALAPMPLRLGGSDRYGVTAAQYARLAADYVAVKRTGALAVLTYTFSGGVVTLTGYLGQNGSGSAHAWAAEVMGTGDVKFTHMTRNFVNDYDEAAPLAAKSAFFGPNGTACRFYTVDVEAASVRVHTFDKDGAAVDTGGTVTVY